jgi:hypothetical protein
MDSAKYNAMLKRRFKIYANVAEKAMLRRHAIDADDDDEEADVDAGLRALAAPLRLRRPSGPFAAKSFFPLDFCLV